MPNKVINFIKNTLPLLIVTGFVVVNMFINIRMNVFKYNNFDFGKFDLGNMTQMVWNTLHGRFLYLTDYFGTNLPRWSMSHVDPILLLLVPLFAIFPHPLTLVFTQLTLVIFSAYIVYALADLKLKSKLSACFISCAYLLYPALGFLNAQTGFHGVTAAMFFFFFAFYLFEDMYASKSFTRKKLILMWLMLIITMSGKEQLPLYVMLFGMYILVFKVFFNSDAVLKKLLVKQALLMMVVGLLWFVTAFFILIPAYAHQRVAGYEKFAASLNIGSDDARNVSLPNYFLSRYDAFGDSYTDVIFGIITNPEKVIRLFFSGDKVENFQKTFVPTLYIPFVAPHVFFMAGPDLLINYMVSTGNVGTSEIYNHRISMIIPVLFISIIFGIATLGTLIVSLLTKLFPKRKFSPQVIFSILSLVTMLWGLKTSFMYENPVYLWLHQAVSKKLGIVYLPKVYADYLRISKAAKGTSFKLGDSVKISELDNKDILCATKIVKMIPDNASVSGPDYLGAHLSMRETYAIFPALYSEADYVIVDVFSRKILTILDANLDLLSSVITYLISSDYEQIASCGNLFVFKKNPDYKHSLLLPMQELYSYEEKVNYQLLTPISVVDYSLPQKITRSKHTPFTLVYTKTDDTPINTFVLYMSFVNRSTGEIYQTANLPSLSVIKPRDWNSDMYYVETLDIVAPQELSTGEYNVFIGATNSVKNRSIYLGTVSVN